MRCALGLTLKSVAKFVLMKDYSMWYNSISVFFASLNPSLERLLDFFSRNKYFANKLQMVKGKLYTIPLGKKTELLFC